MSEENYVLCNKTWLYYLSLASIYNVIFKDNVVGLPYLQVPLDVKIDSEWEKLWILTKIKLRSMCTALSTSGWLDSNQNRWGCYLFWLKGNGREVGASACECPNVESLDSFLVLHSIGWWLWMWLVRWNHINQSRLLAFQYSHVFP